MRNTPISDCSGQHNSMHLLANMCLQCKNTSNNGIHMYYSTYMYVYVVTLFTSKCTFLSNIVGSGIAEGDENCKKFMEKTMPDAFQKVSRFYLFLYHRVSRLYK